MIPIVGTEFHASKLRPEQVNAYRRYQREKVEKQLDEYLYQCSKMKVKGEKLVLENEDVANGITELISLHGVTKLVMGAADVKHYSRKMKGPKSKTALAVMQKADPSCKIWFVCKEHLIWTREAGAPISFIPPSPSASRSSLSTLSECIGSPSQYASNADDGFIMQRSMSENVSHRPGRALLGLPFRANIQTTLNRLSIGDRSVNSWDGVSRGSFPSSYRSSSSVTDELQSETSSFAVPSDDASVILPSVHGMPDLPNPTLYHEQDDMGSNIDLLDKLQEAFTDVDKYRQQAFNESFRRQKSEEELISYHQKAKKSEDLYLKEAKHRKEVEGALAKANEKILLLKQEVDVLKQERDDNIDKLNEVNKQKVALERHVAEADAKHRKIAKDLEDELMAAQYLLDSQQVEFEQLRHERDNALDDAEELRREKEKMVSGSNLALNTEFSLLELQQATQNFSDALKVGEGGFGQVYKGLLRNTTVAIKMLRSQSLQGQSQFQQEVVVLSRVRHPNLVTLIGSCSEASGLIYEFLPNGSLEDRLACANNTPPLTWQVRTRIISEICSALIFLHSDKPHPVIHGDLKPANILLDANLVSKLSDFGISCLLIKSNTASTSLYRTTNPRGTFSYMDPEFLTTGELTTRSDIYSFGIVILRLVTGKPPLGIAREVEDALENNKLESLIDPFAGEWPFVQAKELMLLGLHCAELGRRRRPNHVTDVWRVVEPLMESASLSVAPQSFICPISQEVMRDPHIAADGFTYEAEAIKSWLNSGHSTSPMTNLTLANHYLIRNYALRSAIQEFLQQQQQPS